MSNHETPLQCSLHRLADVPNALGPLSALPYAISPPSTLPSTPEHSQVASVLRISLRMVTDMIIPLTTARIDVPTLTENSACRTTPLPGPSYIHIDAATIRCGNHGREPLPRYPHIHCLLFSELSVHIDGPRDTGKAVYNRDDAGEQGHRARGSNHDEMDDCKQRLAVMTVENARQKPELEESTRPLAATSTNLATTTTCGQIHRPHWVARPPQLFYHVQPNPFVDYISITLPYLVINKRPPFLMTHDLPHSGKSSTHFGSTTSTFTSSHRQLQPGSSSPARTTFTHYSGMPI